MLFNVYYLNFSKVYEIKMMLSNVIMKVLKLDKAILLMLRCKQKWVQSS